ncbi:hypothetical protein [Nocardioides panzhihuensis]|uniref:Uncharacterized protein n=1 Tax=Nocardioides panzhihuensis TaxID=860243 RepID=A0A7Z0DNP7_9ACTN|nr:hypothetical protein [Nocardioides panzhihuensis]NYI78842.1 hypothetical protein [Nocardioides panzhihuensis]
MKLSPRPPNNSSATAVRMPGSARDLGLPEDPDELASLAPGGRCAPLAAALTRARHGLPGLEES